MFYRPIFLGLSLVFICRPTVAAQSDALHEEIEYLKAETFVTTASRYNEKVSDTPSTVFVITKQQIKERGYINLLQVLEGLPNIDIQRNASSVTGDQISIRGLAKNNGFIILQDGVRISSPTGDPIPVNDNFPIHYAKQIEVVYGPASVMYGADALTGVINIISDKAEDIDGVEVKNIAGENNSYSTYVKAGKKFTDNISITAGGHYKESDNPNLARYYPDTFALTDLVTFGGKTVARAADRTGYQGDGRSHSAFAKLTFFNDLDFGLNHSLTKARSDIATAPSHSDYGANAYLYTEMGTAYADYKIHIGEKISGFARANYSWYGLLPESRFVNRYNDFALGGSYKYSSGERKQLETQLQYELNAQHKISGGLSLEAHNSLSKTPDLINPYNPDKSLKAQNSFYPGTDSTLPVKFQHLDYTNIGAYVQWNANWSDMFSTSAALRRDYDSRYHETINPRLGLVFKPVSDVVMKLSYGSAFLAPSPFYSGEHYGSFTGQKNAQGEYVSDYFHLPNVNLKPETIDTYELGVDYHATRRLNLGFGAYSNTAKDIITTASMNPPNSRYIQGGFIGFTEQNQNMGRLVSYGGDAHFDYRYEFVNSELKLWGNYSYVDGEVSRVAEGTRSDGTTDLPIVSKHKVKLGSTFTYQEKYSITPKLYWIGPTNSAQTRLNNANALQVIPSYTRVDLYASAQMLKNFSLFMNVSNLFDKRFYNVGDLYGSSFVASPQDPRVVSGGFILQF